MDSLVSVHSVPQTSRFVSFSTLVNLDLNLNFSLVRLTKCGFQRTAVHKEFILIR